MAATPWSVATGAAYGGSVRPTGVNRSEKDDSTNRPKWTLTKRILHELIDFASERQMRICVVNVPLNVSYKNEMETFLTTEKIPFLPLDGELDSPELHFKHDLHWNAEGHLRAADLIDNWLKTEDIF